MQRIMLWLLPALMLAPPPAAADEPADLTQLRASAERGDTEAMVEVGILYEFGFRMPDHRPPALAWYRLAAQAGNAKAGTRYEALKATMNARDIEQANKIYSELAASVRKPVAASAPAAAGAEAPLKIDNAPNPAPKQEMPAPAEK